jgi:hypothetical protein
MNQNLSKEVKISKEITVTNGAAGTTDINGTVLDMSGFEGVLFIVQLGAITANAVTSIKAQQGSAGDTSDLADLTGTNQTIADTDDEKVLYIDVYRPTKRYVSLFVDRGTANAVVSAIAMQYGARKEPTTHGSGVAGETWISPAEGTA